MIFEVGTASNPELNNAAVPTEVEDLFEYITNVDIQKGHDYIDEGNINDLDDLKYVDGNKYEIQSTFYPLEEMQFKIVAEFKYDIDLDTYCLDFYDVLLFLEIEAPTCPDAIVQLEAYTENGWQKICDIDESGVTFNGLLLERTTKLRLLSTSTSDFNILKIEQMKIVLCHEGNIGKTFISSVDSVGFSESHYAMANDRLPPGADSNWWVGYFDDSIAASSSQHMAMWRCNSWSQGLFKLYFDLDFSTGTITDVTNVINLGIQSYQMAYANLWVEICQNDMFIKDQSDGSWDHKKTSGLSAAYADIGLYVMVNQSWDDEVNNDWQRYIKVDRDELSSNYGDAYIELKSLTTGQASGLVATAWTRQKFLSAGGTIEFEGYGFNDYDYPNIGSITQQDDMIFEIKGVESKIKSCSIDKVEYMLQNDENYYDWQEITGESEGVWKLLLNLMKNEYESGTYNLWIKVTDEFGYSTLECLSIEIPFIHVYNPNGIDIAYDNRYSPTDLRLNYGTAIGVVASHYILDGQPAQVLPSDGIFSKPDIGYHTIKIIGYDAQGQPVESEETDFYISNHPPGVLGTPVETILKNYDVTDSIIVEGLITDTDLPNELFLKGPPRPISGEYVKSNDLRFDYIHAYIPCVLLKSEEWYHHEFTLTTTASSSNEISFQIGLGFMVGYANTAEVYGGGSFATIVSYGLELNDYTEGGKTKVIYFYMEFLHVYGSVTYWNDEIREYDVSVCEYINHENTVSIEYDNGVEPLEIPLSKPVFERSPETPENPIQVFNTLILGGTSKSWSSTTAWTNYIGFEWKVCLGWYSGDLSPIGFTFSGTVENILTGEQSQAIVHTFTRTENYDDNQYYPHYRGRDNVYSYNFYPIE